MSVFLWSVNLFAQCPIAISQRNNGNGGCGGGIDFSVTFNYPTCPTSPLDITTITLSNGQIYSNIDAITSNNFTMTLNTCSGNNVRYCINITGSNPNAPAGAISFRFGDGSTCAYNADNTPTPALPIELDYFTADQQGTRNTLRWRTLSEENTSHFIVEHSTDGLNFSELGSVKARGFSTTPIEYVFSDKNQFPVVYYRLKSVDNDGTYSLSDITMVKLTHIDEESRIAPNPVNDILRLYFTSKMANENEYIITDLLGRVCLKNKITIMEGQNVLEVSLADFPQGSYTISLVNGVQKITHQIVKIK